MLYRLKLTVKHSRPLFWMYLAGPFIVGYILAIDSLYDFYDMRFWVGLVYFLIPANIFLYFVNDYSDVVADSNNPKKNGVERKMLLNEVKDFRLIIIIAFTISLFYGRYLSTYSTDSVLILALFLFLSYFYSMPPLRFKTRFVVDFLSNGLYFLPGIIGYLVASNFDNLYSLSIIIAALLWTSAMHLFSATVDIESDTNSKVVTSAVRLGKRKSLIVCGLFWLTSAIIITLISNHYLSIILYIYPILCIYSTKLKALDRLYWKFPIINVVIGFVIILPKLLSII